MCADVAVGRTFWSMVNKKTIFKSVINRLAKVNDIDPTAGIVPLFKGIVFHQVPDTAGAGPGTEPAPDAAIGIDTIFKRIVFIFGSADGGLGTCGNTNPAVPATAA